ncbi:MAG TPA: ArsC/Spx/MgsR family protein [Candidatus Thermoplasmatota archaeon]|nr:ArsC/Spx/MgsR family protein [Candidatus Thermoplasmatota archaeon]
MFTVLTLYHNPQDEKCKQVLALLEDEGVEVKVINYLKMGLTRDEAERLLVKLNYPDPMMALRTEEEDYKALGLASKKLSRGEVAEILHKHPRLLVRPLVMRDQKIIVADPPKRVLELLD